MPIYEYECERCRHELEKIQKFSDAPLVDCPECGAPALRRKISAPAFRLKGGGWYETDFKSGNSKKNLAEGAAGAGEASKASGEASKSSGGAESAPAPASSAPSAPASGASGSAGQAAPT